MTRISWRLLICADAEDFARHPDRRYEYMGGIGKERRLVALDKVPEPGQRESRWNQQQSDDPVEPNYHQRREANRNGDHVQGAVHGMVVGAVVVLVETHGKLRLSKVNAAADYTPVSRQGASKLRLDRRAVATRPK